MRGRESWRGLFFLCLLGFRVGVGSSNWFLGGFVVFFFFVVDAGGDGSFFGRSFFFSLLGLS